MISVLVSVLANTSSRLLWLSSASPEDAGHSSTSLASGAFALATCFSTNSAVRSGSAAKHMLIQNIGFPTAQHSNRIQLQLTLPKPNNFGIFSETFRHTQINTHVFVFLNLMIYILKNIHNYKQYPKMYCKIVQK